MQFPVAIVSGGAVIAVQRGDFDFVGPDGRNHPGAAWDLWTAEDWIVMCPGWTILPLIDVPPSVAGKRAERLPAAEWIVEGDAVRVAYRLVDLRPEEATTQAATLKQQVADAVQRHLDGIVATRNYASAAAAVSYVGDPNPQWDAEGRAVRDWRSAVWGACFAALDAVLAGEREPLTPEQMIAELPALIWPQ